MREAELEGGVKMDDLFSLAASRAARDESMKQADGNAEATWKVAALDAVHRVALSNATLTADDVHRAISGNAKTHEMRAMGPVMMRGRRHGWIESTGTMIQSAKKQCHAGPRTLWRSLIYST